MAGKITELNESSLSEFIAENTRAVVDFWAPWCGPCLKMAPTLEELAQEMPDTAFAKINIDENQKTAQEHGIQAIPTLLVFSKGKKTGEITGLRPKESLRAKILESL